MKPTAEDIFATLPPGVQDELINELFSRAGATVLRDLLASDSAGLNEWLCRAYGQETNIALEVALQPVGGPADCANCGADGSFTECAKCGGKSYFVALNTSVCKTCGTSQEKVSPSPDLADVATGGEDLPF